MKIQKIEYLENKKSFLYETKNIFKKFLKGYRLDRIENLYVFDGLYKRFSKVFL